MAIHVLKFAFSQLDSKAAERPAKRCAISYHTSSLYAEGQPCIASGEPHSVAVEERIQSRVLESDYKPHRVFRTAGRVSMTNEHH